MGFKDSDCKKFHFYNAERSVMSMIFNLDNQHEEMTDVGQKCREVLLRMKQEIENFDPDADYSEDQIIMLSLQIMSSVMPTIDDAMTAMQEAQEDPE